MDEDALTASARAVARADWRSTLARFGLVAKGVLYGSLGVLAIEVAAGRAASESATKRGAIELVASQPFGQALLAVLTAGLFALAAWEGLRALTGDPVEGSQAGPRARFAAKAVVYLATALTALAILAGDAGGGSGVVGREGEAEDQAASLLMSWPGGRWLVGALGAAALAFGVHQIVRHGWHASFMARLRRSEMDDELARAVTHAGQAGYTARGLAIACAGAFFVAAAVRHDPSEAAGLSGTLALLVSRRWGPGVLWLVAVGLVLYGFFCLAEARYRRAA